VTAPITDFDTSHATFSGNRDTRFTFDFKNHLVVVVVVGASGKSYQCSRTEIEVLSERVLSSSSRQSQQPQ
jgi:hypothetical protein